MSRTLTLAVERIADDRRFAARFRDDPARALRRYRLSDQQVEAVKAGDPASLAAHGVDLTRFESGKRHGWRPWWRKLLVGVTVAGAVIGLTRSPAAAVDICKDPCFPRRGPRVVGIRRAWESQGARAVSLRAVLGRSSIRRALARNGIRVGYGRIALRAALRASCEQGCEPQFDGDPILLAD